MKCCLLLFYTTTMNNFLIRFWLATKSGFYTAASDDQLSGWTEKKLQSTSQNQTCTKKRVIVTVWWSAAGLIRYSVLNPGEAITSERYTQQIDETHRKLQHLQPDSVNRKGPAFLCDYAGPHTTPPVLPTLNKLGYQVLPHQPCSPDLLPTDYHLLKHLNNVLQGKCFHNQKEVENAFQGSLNLEAWVFTLQEHTSLFLIGKNALIVMVPILINKDMFESSYIDLKFTAIQNCNYHCTNPIGLWIKYTSLKFIT